MKVAVNGTRNRKQSVVTHSPKPFSPSQGVDGRREDAD